MRNMKFIKALFMENRIILKMRKLNRKPKTMNNNDILFVILVF